MRRRSRHSAAAGLAVAVALMAQVAGVANGSAGRADEHYRRALELLERNTIDTRRLAMRELEQATLLDPSNATYQLTLARTYFTAGFLRQARGRFERLARTTRDPGASFGLGQVWRRDWLKFLDRRSLERSIESFSRAAALDPGACDPWIVQVPLLVESGDSGAAAAAAQRALEAAPDRAEALLAVAYTAFRTGWIERSDSAFSAVLPSLPGSVRERLEDISPVASERDTAILRGLEPGAQVEFVRRFWKDCDPDLATPENEAQLEYWSRVAHAYFLFYDPRRREWDERGEVYVRYGAPARARYNPVGVSLADWAGTPRNVLVWEYPHLGMEVLMEDRLLSEYYLLPVTLTYDPDPRPDPDSLARRHALATGGGRGVFPVLPPGATRLPVEGMVARFEGERAPRLLAQIETPGGPADSLWAEWVVLDSSRTEVRRGSRALSPSACAATERRVADFATDLAPGDYLVGLTVRDGKGGRGVFRSGVEVGARRPELGLSDIVIACGAPDASAPARGVPAVRIEPNPSGRVERGDPLTAYFEIYHLSPGEDGEARFEYVYAVRSIEKDPRIWLKRLFAPRPYPPGISASREETNPGPLRRQFVTVPVQSLPSGRYELRVEVRDLVAGTMASGTAEFLKAGDRRIQ